MAMPDVAGGAVLEADRAGKTADELAMDLALRGARADGAPAYEAGDVLRRDHVEEFGAGGDAHLGEIEQQIARHAQAVVDVVGLVEMRIVDEALPADGGARLFEVDAHDDEEICASSAASGLRRRAYSSAASVSWMEQGPTTTRRRRSVRPRILRIC